ncbi:hypothetical protein V6N12_049192 [Hibiscus sabdariffa]|uniref:RNase H type-1 domain-containing protein n=1 Tax=Hibiscus sabdariffa TaxID=183260 RepID=A0ABR2EL02_9ROSI
MEHLGHRILHDVRNGSWRPFRLVRGDIPISHLFFADGLILYAQASPDQVPNSIPSQSSFLHWCPAPSGWLTLNTNGYVSTSSSYGSASSLIRDNEGSWLTGFNRYLGITTPLQAELWAIHEGLLLAWSLVFERLQCQMDCVEAFSLITSSNANSSSLSLVRAISRLASRAWMVGFCLIRWVANEAADSISKIPSYSDGSTFIFSDAPSEIKFCLLRDAPFVASIS